MITSIAHLAVTVHDMKESLRFYTEVLGLTKAFSIAHPETGEPWIEYLCIAKGQFLELFYNGTVENPFDHNKMGFNHLCLEVDDIHATVAQIQASGWPIDVMPKQGSDNNWQAWIRDPNGIRIELMKISSDSPQAKFS